jgi:3-oxoadipate enol-lactonase
MESNPDTPNSAPESFMGVAHARDGAAIAYTLLKDGGGERPRVVLIHSLAMDRSFWDRVVPILAGEVDLLVYDCRGHGASDKPAGPYTVEQFADDLRDLMDAVGWKSATVAGASMGGCVSLAFAAGYPENTDGLGLLDTTAYYGDDAPEKWAGRAEKATTEGMGALVEFQKTRWFGEAFRAAHPDILQNALDVFLANDVAAYAETCRMLGAADKRDALSSLRMPVAIMVGEEDYATPIAMAEAMKAEIPHASLQVIPGARHFTPLEVPEETCGLLLTLAKGS